MHFVMAKLKGLEGDNRRLKKMHANERLKAEITQEDMEKSGTVIPVQRYSSIGGFCQG